MGMETGHQERNIMTSNEEMAEKLAEKFYGLIEGDVSVSGGELANCSSRRSTKQASH